jgi:hypothetical protein
MSGIKVGKVGSVRNGSFPTVHAEDRGGNGREEPFCLLRT